MKRFAPYLSRVMAVSLFLVFAIWLTPVSANTPPVFSSLGQLRSLGMGAPGAMDVDAAGNLYVADAMGRKIHVFDPYGNLKKVYDLKASGRGLAVTPDGKRLYAARSEYKKDGYIATVTGSVIIVDTASGAILGELTGSGDTPEFGTVGEIDLDSAGRVFVADASAGRMMVKIYSADGQFLGQFGGTGAITGKFQSISGLTVNGSNQIVVADTSPAAAGGMIQVFTLDPATLAVANVTGYVKNGLANFGSVELHNPKGMAFDELGRGYVLEYMFSTITVVSSSFTLLNKYEQSGSGAGQLAFVADAVYDPTTKRLFVSCDGGRIEVFGIDGGTSPVYVNAPPTVPAVQSPKDGIIVLTATPSLAYDAATDDRDTATLTYQVLIKQGDATVHTFAPTTDTSVTVPAGILADDIVYSWMVQAIDSTGLVSGFSGAATFVINTNDPPSVPKNLTPDGSSMVTIAEPVLSYDAALDDYDTTLTYEIIVKQGATQVHKATTTATSLTVPAGVLAENTVYSWTVQATDSKGLASDLSAAASFVFNAVDEAPTAPELLEPAAAAVMASAGQFVWTASTDPDPNDNVKLYQVEIATDAAFGDVVASAQLEGTSLALGDFADYAKLVVGASYFCRVTAIDMTDDTPSAPSAAVTFVYDTSVLTVDAPISGSAVFLGGNLAYSGRFVGTTPLQLRDLAPGNYVVTVEAAGFEPYLANVPVVENAKPDVLATLKPAMQPTAFKGAKAINGKPGLKVSAAATPFVIDYAAVNQLDLLVGDAAGVVHRFPSIQVAGNGEMTVGAEVVPAVKQLFQGAVLFVADWNNDDRNDLLVGLADGTVKLFLEGAAEVLVQAGDVPLTVGASAAPLVIDLNRDGLKDLVVGNAAGQVAVCYNTGTDAEPKLAAPVQLFTVGVPVVPTAVDWNADGVRELTVASAKGIAVYSNESGAFVAKMILATPAKAVFAVDADGGKGKDLIIGAEDGRLLYAAASLAIFPATYPAALLAKLDEVTGLINAAGLNFAAELVTIRGQIELGSYLGAATQSQSLTAALPAGSAAAISADELALLCNTKGVAGETVSTSPGNNSANGAKK